MKIKWALLALSFFSYSHHLFSQNASLRTPNYTVHSPDVTSLGQYGEYPVDMSTGVPQISIPLYVIKSKKMENPVSISYHAGGIKVDQESSFIGLGWVLNFGGVITRMVRGLPDEGPMGFLQTGGTLPNYNPIDDLQGAGAIGTSQDLKNLFVNDLEPDLFSFSVNGLSGEFCLNNNGAFVSINQEPFSYEVDLTNNLIIIKDKIGNIYRFGKALDGTPAFENPNCTYSSLNTSIPFPGTPSSNNTSYTTAWYLTEIISADLSDIISFKYRNGYYSDGKIFGTTRYIYHDSFLGGPLDALGQLFNGTIFSGVNTILTNQQIPYKILYNNGSIEFTTSHDRLDMQVTSNSPEKTRINGMNIYDNNGSLFRRVVFDNPDHFDRTAAGSALTYNTAVSNYKKKSLKLNGVKFFDRNNIMVNDYKFEYDPTPMPPRNTTPQDFWGYYNGKDNTTLIPQAFYINTSNGPTYIGDNRKSDFNFMKAGVLKKIIYPTGGYTVYDYEPNYYLTHFQQVNEIEETKKISFWAINRLPECDPGFLNGIPANNTVEFTVTDNIINNGIDAGKLYVYFTDYVNNNWMEWMTFKITDLDNNDYYSCEHPPSERTQQKTYQTDFTIRKGHRYKIEAKTNGVTGSNFSICNSPFIEMGWTYKHLVKVPVDQITPEQAGGLRVKSITIYENNNSEVSKKIYEYNDNTHGVGVGKLVTEPNKNFYIYPLLYAVSSDQKELRKIIWFSSESQTELGMAHGCPVDYEKVVEKQVQSGTNNINEKSEYYYSPTIGDYDPKSSSKYPYNTVYYPTWKKKNLNKVIQFKFQNSVFTPVKSTEYFYQNVPESRIKTLKIIDFEPDLYSSIRVLGVDGLYHWMDFYDNPDRFYYYNYYVSRGRYLLSKEVVKEYANNGAEIVTVKDMEYNSQFDLRKEKFTNSKSEQIENHYKYTADLGYTNLITKNMLSLPVQQEQLLNGKVREGTILRYNDFGGISERHTFASVSPLVPVPYTSILSLPAYYEKKQTLFYDQNKKLIREVKDENGINTIYIWSYQNQYPVAEIKNADYTTIEVILGSAAIESFTGSNPTPEAVKSFLAPLRTDPRLKTAVVTTYTFEPLLGLTSETNLQGKTTYYEYDGFGRLKRILDQDKNIVKSFDYQYRQQP